MSHDVTALIELLPPRPKHADDLFGNACERCRAVEICGEAHGPTACSGLRGWSDGVAHPDERQLEPHEIDFPPTGFQWHRLDLAYKSVLSVVSNGKYAHLGAASPLESALAKSTRASNPDVAVLLGRDELLDRLWGRLWDLPGHLISCEFKACVAPGFSTWWDYSPLDSLISVRRTVEAAHLLSQHLPTIPTVVWSTGKDIERQVAWLNLKAAETPAIAVDLGVRLASESDELLRGVRLLAQLARADGGTRLVVSGIGKRSRLEALSAAWAGPVTLVSRQPHLCAVKGRRLTPSLKSYRDDTTPTDQLLLDNVATVASTVLAVFGNREHERSGGCP